VWVALEEIVVVTVERQVTQDWGLEAVSQGVLAEMHLLEALDKQTKPHLQDQFTGIIF
jgi:hypothetical protein